MADDFIVNVRQIGQYPLVTAALSSDLLLIQRSGLGGPYQSIGAGDLVSSALENGGWLRLAPGNGIAWNGAALSFSNGFNFSSNITVAGSVTAASVYASDTVAAATMTVGGVPVASVDYVNALSDDVFNGTVHSFNGRTGTVQLEDQDILRAGGVLQINPVFGGAVIVPTLWDPRTDNDQAASTGFVQNAICHWLMNSPLVQSFNGRTGAVELTADDITAAATAPGAQARANTPPLGDASTRIATTGFVDESIMDLQDSLQQEINEAISGAYAPINSPAFTGHPTAPTPAPGDNTGNLATTAFVQHAIVASTTGVASWNTRTGAVTMTAADITGAGGALLAGPVFTGVPQAPTATPGNSSQQLATTAFVSAAIAAIPTGGVSSFNTRTGAVTLTTADITGAGGAPIASPAFSGNPTATTQAPGTSNTTLATTAFVAAAMSGVTAGVSSFNTRTGAVTLQSNDISAVGGALLNSPGFSGVPTAPTATVGTSSTQLATTAFVQQQIAAIASGVTSWNTRTGAVTLTAADVSGVGGAMLASPAFTGTPTAPTAPQTSNDTTIASTAYVRAALAAAPGGVSSFNTRTGAITLVLADISAAGGAPISSPSFTGTVSAPTPAPGNNSQQVATTAFVMSALSASGGVNSFNGRAGAVVLNATDLQSANGAIYFQADTAPALALGTPNTFWFDSLHGQLYVQYKDPSTNALSWLIANSPPAQPVPAHPGQLSGLTLNWLSVSGFSTGIGAACSDDGSTTMVLSTAMVKAPKSAWAAGTGNGSLDTGAVGPNVWYHVYLIMNPTTAAVDLLTSTNPASPTMPSGFTLKRRIGSIKTDASNNLVNFIQLGDRFLWAVPTLDYNGGGAAVAPPGTNVQLNIPMGVKTDALIIANLNSATVGQQLLVQSPDQIAAAGNGNFQGYVPVANGFTSADLQIRSNTNSQVNVASGNAIGSGLYILTKGWVDNRGK